MPFRSRRSSVLSPGARVPSAAYETPGFRTHHPSPSGASSSFAWPRKKSMGRRSMWGQSDDSLATRYTESVRPKNGSTANIEPISDNTLFISLNLSSPFLGDDRRNHTCPILGVLPDPEHKSVQYGITPSVTRYEDMKFKTVREAVDFFHQILQGLEFMHENYVAHRDCSSNNIAMLEGSNPPEYYLTISPASRQYRADGGRPVAMPFWGNDKSVPEFQRSPTDPHDPFRADVYTLGNMIRKDFVEVYSNLSFMEPLVTEMISPDPARRPMMDEVIDRFTEDALRLSDRAFRQPLRRRWRHRFPLLFRDQREH
ncbi:uncharacterized protein BXZ73DRAFT_102106 [Epithele typhae]|uniref:uncharacterized protein n=1 Tax=Epithele typhae TaxID=378194 RepID=UPI0020080115|nr:uncharacterized protein BXZ73DRAFT_102106 [Epithele typhae]KAH9929578.1 hypothetical protein BXZ73DRAFT_102106 [Epithele typhae]